MQMPGNILRSRVLIHEQGKCVQIRMIKFLKYLIDRRPEPAKINKDPGVIQLFAADMHIHLPVVPVLPGTVALVVIQVMCRREMRGYADLKHIPPFNPHYLCYCQRACEFKLSFSPITPYPVTNSVMNR